jgi:hypothetical protein
VDTDIDPWSGVFDYDESGGPGTCGNSADFPYTVENL